jgi:Na+/H+-dicarboxylate symporter
VTWPRAATLIIIRWLMYFLPIGVAALVIPLTAQLGSEIVAALGQVTLMVLTITVGLILSLYIVVAVVGRISPWAFARAVAPGQAVALTTRSSLAAFPALMKGAHDHLPLPHGVVDFLLPIVTFNVRMSRAVNMVEFVLIGQLAGMTVGYGLMAAYLIAKLGVKAGKPGLPSTGKSSFAVMVALGMPIEAALLVTAITPLIDPVSTTLNVTGDMAITAVAGHLGLLWSGDRTPASLAAEPQPVVAS